VEGKVREARQKPSNIATAGGRRIHGPGRATRWREALQNIPLYSNARDTATNRTLGTSADSRSNRRRDPQRAPEGGELGVIPKLEHGVGGNYAIWNDRT